MLGLAGDGAARPEDKPRQVWGAQRDGFHAEMSTSTGDLDLEAEDRKSGLRGQKQEILTLRPKTGNLDFEAESLLWVYISLN